MGVAQFIWRCLAPFRMYLIGPLFVSLLYSFDVSVRPYLMKLLINTVSMPDGKAHVPQLWTLASYFIALQFLVPLSWRLFDWCMLRMEPALKNHIAKTAFEYVTKQDARFYQENFTGSLSSKINDLAAYIPQIITITINNFFATALTIVIAIWSLSQVHLWFAIGMAAWCLLLLLVATKILKRFHYLARNTSEVLTKIMGQIVDSLGNMLSIRLFSARKHELERLEKIQDEYLVASRARRWFMLKFYGLQGFSFSIYQTFSLALLISLFAQGKVTPGDFVMILTINFWVVDCLWALTEQMRNFSENWASVDQALRTLYVPLDVQDRAGAKQLQISKGEIVFEDVQFRYIGAEPLFQKKSIRIPAGQKVGLVGYSGSGKTTFVNIILRLFDISSGHVYIDGQDIQSVSQDSLRAAIAMIPQEPTLFHRSLLENIRYGRFDAADEEVIQAAKMAHADDFIQALPQKYATLVGERGVKLSGGQRQRIAIARAILKASPILILDEATSQLDSVTEAKIQESIWQLMQGKTAIVIAHRLSTLLQMDRILVFHKGKIVEDGNHFTLLTKRGLYKSLWDAQIGGFLPETIPVT